MFLWHLTEAVIPLATADPIISSIMITRKHQQPVRPSRRKCQQCEIEYQVGELQSLTKRLELLEQMHRSSKESRTRKTRSDSQSKLQQLNKKLERFEKQLRKNSEENQRLSQLADRMLEMPHMQETTSNYTQQSNVPRLNRMESATTFNKEVNPTKQKSCRSDSLQSQPLTVDELVQRFSGLVLQGTNRQCVSELNRRDELIQLAGRIRKKKRDSQLVPPISEYGM